MRCWRPRLLLRIFLDSKKHAVQVGIAHALHVTVAPEGVEAAVVRGVPVVDPLGGVRLVFGAAPLAAEAERERHLVLPDDQSRRRARDERLGLPLRRRLALPEAHAGPEVAAVAA